MNNRMDVEERLRANMTSIIKSELPCEMKTEPPFDHEKENCDDVSKSSNLVIDFASKNRDIVTEIKQEPPDDENFSQDNVDSALPILSEMLNEDDNARDSVAEDEMKYEDDIEEEEYDSDEESISADNYEMFSFGKSPGSGNSHGSINGSNTEADSCHSEQSLSYFDTSFNHQKGARLKKKNLAHYSDTNDIVNDLRREAGDEPTDSVLLSIVYATINVPFSQVSKFLTAYNLSKSQLSVIGKVRRQVKNRLYAQNCRRRRVAHIKNLTNEVKKIKNEKERLLTERGDLMVKKMSLQWRYKQLHNHVMGMLASRSKKDSLQFADGNMNVSDDVQTNITKRKLAQERVQWEAKRRKLENQYKQLHDHVFDVISTRSCSGDGVTKGGLNDDNLDFKLCNMNIANELAMLNKYYRKNATASADGDSNASVDYDSAVSENKLDDLVEYESGCGSRTEESHRYSTDFVDDGEIGVTTTTLDENDDKRSDNSATENWSGASEVDENEDEEAKESDESGDEIEFILDDLDDEYDDLEKTKKRIEDKYEQLYDCVSKALKMNEIDFVKTFMEYCLQLLAAKVPKRDLCSFAFGKS